MAESVKAFVFYKLDIYSKSYNVGTTLKDLIDNIMVLKLLETKKEEGMCFKGSMTHLQSIVGGGGS